MKTKLGQREKRRTMNNEEIQPDIAMETTSRWIRYTRLRKCILLIKYSNTGCVRKIFNPLSFPRFLLLSQVTYTSLWRKTRFCQCINKYLQCHEQSNRVGQRFHRWLDRIYLYKKIYKYICSYIHIYVHIQYLRIYVLYLIHTYICVCKTKHSLSLNKLLSSRPGLLRQHRVRRRTDPKQSGCTFAHEWCEDSWDKPFTDRPGWGALHLLQCPGWSWCGPSPMESSKFSGKKIRNIVGSSSYS